MVRKLIGGLAIFVAAVAASLYCVHHYWWWLNAPSHVSGVQAATAIILGVPTALFAVFATIAAIQSVEAYTRQAEAADKQAAAADRQAAAADAQVAAANAQSILASKQLEIASDTLREQIRPVISLEKVFDDLPFNDDGQMFFLKNVGQGSAIDLTVEFIDEADNSLGVFKPSSRDVTVPPNGIYLVPAVFRDFNQLAVFYKSMRAEGYLSVISVAGEMVTATYGPSDCCPLSEKTFPLVINTRLNGI